MKLRYLNNLDYMQHTHEYLYTFISMISALVISDRVSPEMVVKTTTTMFPSYFKTSCQESNPDLQIHSSTPNPVGNKEGVDSSAEIT